MLLTALSTGFLAASLLLLAVAVSRSRSDAENPQTASGRVDSAPSDQRDDAPDTSGTVAEPETTVATEPEELQVPFAWSDDGIDLLPFGSRQDEVISTVSDALGTPPDEVEAVTMSECTAGTNARWDQPEVRLSFDESGRFASATFPTEIGRTTDGAVETLGDLQATFPGVSVEYVPPNPEWGYDDASYNWSIDGADASASGTLESDGPDASVGSVRLDSKRFDGVECFE